MKASRMLWLVSYKLENGTLITYENVLLLNDFWHFNGQKKQCGIFKRVYLEIAYRGFRAKSNIRQYGMSATTCAIIPIYHYQLHKNSFLNTPPPPPAHGLRPPPPPPPPPLRCTSALTSLRRWEPARMPNPAKVNNATLGATIPADSPASTIAVSYQPLGVESALGTKSSHGL